MNLVLCGMMGVGKTTVGIKIAELTGRRWYDTDGLITDRHGKIPDIFEYYGEPHFRKLETEIIRELSLRDGLVISTGGGAVMKTENTAMLKRGGKIVYLRATIDTLVSRLNTDNSRPLLQSTEQNIRTRLTKLLNERTPVYEHVADLTIDVDGKTPEEIAKEILANFAGC